MKSHSCGSHCHLPRSPQQRQGQLWACRGGGRTTGNTSSSGEDLSAYVHTGGSQRLKPGIFLHSSPPYWGRTTPWTQSSLVRALSDSWVLVLQRAAQHSWRCWCFCLCGKGFYPLSHLPSTRFSPKSHKPEKEGQRIAEGSVTPSRGLGSGGSNGFLRLGMPTFKGQGVRVRLAHLNKGCVEHQRPLWGQQGCVNSIVLIGLMNK